MSERMNFSSISARKASSICRPGTNNVRTSVLSTSAVFFSAPLSLSNVFEKKPMDQEATEESARATKRRSDEATEGKRLCIAFPLRRFVASSLRRFRIRRPQRVRFPQHRIQHPIHECRAVFGAEGLG